VNPVRLATKTADGDFVGAVDGSDEVFKFSHSVTFVSVVMLVVSGRSVTR
jgi:hypothetical protein